VGSLDPIGATAAKTAGAAAGAALAALKSSHLSPWQRVVTFLGGFFAALFLTDPIVTWFRLVPIDKYEHGVAFILGLFGMTVFEIVFTTDWKSIIKKRIGG